MSESHEETHEMAGEGGRRAWWAFERSAEALWGAPLSEEDGKFAASNQIDPLGQLRAETKWTAKTPGTRSWQYAYSLDPNGNRLQEFAGGALTAYDFGDNNEMLSAGDWDFTYDHFGNTTGQDDRTNSYAFAWDYESHMTQATGAGTDTHEYDGDGRRMRSKLNSASDWTNFIYDELPSSCRDGSCAGGGGVGGGCYPALLAEYTSISGTFAIQSLNTWGIGLVSTNRGGTKRYFHFDGLGSTVALTDVGGTVQDTYTTSAFGVLESSTGASVNPFRYVG